VCSSDVESLWRKRTCPIIMALGEWVIIETI